VLRRGRQYSRPVRQAGVEVGVGDAIGWSRILDVEEALIVVNGNGVTAVGGRRVLVDAQLNAADSRMTVIANTEQSGDPAGFAGPHPVGTSVPVERDPDGTAFVTVDSLGPSEVLVLINRPRPVAGGVRPDTG
jgi:hypothetical protein